jgi:hypothetical protein
MKRAAEAHWSGVNLLGWDHAIRIVAWPTPPFLSTSHLLHTKPTDAGPSVHSGHTCRSMGHCRLWEVSFDKLME